MHTVAPAINPPILLIDVVALLLALPPQDDNASPGNPLRSCFSTPGRLRTALRQFRHTAANVPGGAARRANQG